MMGRFKMWLCVGIFLSSLLVINSDASCLPSSCQNGGTCVNNKCSCTSGYTGNQCELDIDECMLYPGICQNGGKCYNNRGSYICICTAVYTGKSCSISIDDCKTSDGSPACENNGTCIDGLGGYSCICPDEYIGQRCQYQDECKMNKTRCGTGICDKDLNGSAICICHGTGYNGTSCENDIDECSLHVSPCDKETSTCVNTPGSYECKCKDGWQKEVFNECTKFIDSCASNPCLNNGYCVTHLNSYKCLCTSGYRGDRCQIKINECDSNPCLNFGQCVDIDYGYMCV